MFMVQHHCSQPSTVSACQTLSPGLPYRKKETQMPDWVQKQTGYEQSLLWALYSSYSQKSLTLPIMSLCGGHRAKRMASQLPCCRCTPKVAQSLCVSVLCKFLTFITANSFPCSFLIFCLKKITSLWFWQIAKQAHMFNLPPLLQWILIHFSI